jgi:hypothetical protein
MGSNCTVRIARDTLDQPATPDISAEAQTLKSVLGQMNTGTGCAILIRDSTMFSSGRWVYCHLPLLAILIDKTPL